MLRRLASPPTRHWQRSNDLLTREADRCVKCGLCLPHCPTYQITQDESESPRGRIALIEALAAGHLAPNSRLDAHLDSCLMCRRCERVCPSGVNYGALMDQARRSTRHLRPRWLRILAALLSRPAVFGPLLRLGRMAPLSTANRVGQLTVLARVSDRQTPPPPGVFPALQARRGRVGLFLGCAGRFSQAAALHDSLRLLRLLGFEVTIPRAQVCCGALHAHLGDAEQAEAFARRNRTAFDCGLDAIISIATGCGAHLATDPRAAGLLPAPHQDINAFVAAQPLSRLRWRPLAAKIAIHTPCSQLNTLRSAHAVQSMLTVIPGIDLVELPDNARCCGAAGRYLFSHPATATYLKDLKIASLNQSKADYALTSNPGCALHFKTGLAAANSALRVLHPVQLLMQQCVVPLDAATRLPAKPAKIPNCR